MSHIHNEPGQVDQTTSAYIIRLDSNNPKVLLHMHKKYKILLPVGGHIELDETPWAALVREIREESGYSIDDLEILQPKRRIKHEYSDRIVHPLPFFINTHSIPGSITHWHSDQLYCLVANGKPSLEIASDESQDLRWYTQAEIKRLKDTSQVSDSHYQIIMFIFSIALVEYDLIKASEFRIDKLIQGDKWI